MTFTEWLKMLGTDAPEVEAQFGRLLEAGFRPDNQVDVERLEDLSIDSQGQWPWPSRATPTTIRIVLRRNRTYELVSDASLDLVSASVEGSEGELSAVAWGNNWESVIDAILETDQQ